MKARLTSAGMIMARGARRTADVPACAPSRPLRAFLIVTMALSGVVLVEPAPFDILIAIFFVMFVFCGLFFLPRALYFPLSLLSMFLFFNCFSAISAIDSGALARFLMINVYMLVIFLSIAAIVYTWRDGARILLAGYLTSCVLIGCISLFIFFSGYNAEFMFLFGRLKGTFKDPNVFAPFMILGVLYCLLRVEEGGARAAWYFGYVVVLALCVVLAASRGAWGNFAASLLAYLAARVWQGARTGAGAARAISLVVVLSVTGSAVVAAVDYAQFGEFLTMRAQMQAYDESRFAVQGLGLQMAMNNLLGYGPGQFEGELGSTVWTGSNAAHSLFVRLLFENGVGGFLSFIAFLGFSLAVALRLATIPWRFRGLACVSGSSLIGGIVNSAVIDTLHWRHFWIQLGLIWGLYAVYKRELRQ